MVPRAGVVELVDTPALGAGAARCGGSSPSARILQGRVPIAGAHPGRRRIGGMLRWLILSVLGALLLVPTGAAAKPISMPYDELGAARSPTRPGGCWWPSPSRSGSRRSSCASCACRAAPSGSSSRSRTRGRAAGRDAGRERVRVPDRVRGGPRAPDPRRLRRLAAHARRLPPVQDAAPLRLAAGTTGFAVAEGRCGLPQIATVAPDGTVTPVAPATRRRAMPRRRMAWRRVRGRHRPGLREPSIASRPRASHGSWT